MMNRIYSLGYAGWKIQDFIQFLKGHDIEVLVDVRRFPTSKNPEFIRENLQSKLQRNGVKYECMSETLGGFRKGGYEKYVETETFLKGIRRLLELAENGNVAIMCLERSSKYCHRKFIDAALDKKGINVVDI
jgi:uncharacterized protein (DUF488 family)